MDRTRNEHLRGTAQVGCLFGRKVRGWRWFGPVQMGDSGFVVRKMLEIELPGKSREEKVC